jgi:uncharacterized membrane protein YqjE
MFSTLVQLLVAPVTEPLWRWVATHVVVLVVGVLGGFFALGLVHRDEPQSDDGRERR